jgi:hypothetical protein
MKVYVTRRHVHVVIDLLFFLSLPKAVRTSLLRQAQSWLPPFCRARHYFRFDPVIWGQLARFIERYWADRIRYSYVGGTCHAR